MVFSIVNHKGVTGKNTTTINPGSALALHGFKVCLVDFDAQGSLTYSLGIPDNCPTIAESLFHEIPAHKILHEREGMHVLPAGQTLADAELAIAKSGDHFGHLKRILSQLPPHDFIHIDCPPSLSLLALNVLVASDDVVGGRSSRTVRFYGATGGFIITTSERKKYST